MNFLAHAFLAGADPADRLGGLMGDFVKGPLPAGLPENIAAGVRLHRQIDVFAESNPAFRRSKARVSAPRRRVAGIMVDMFYDHFLARDWEDFAPQPLEAFSAEMYALLAAHAAILPPRLAQILPRMRADDWLASYRAPEIIELALDRMASRLRRANPLGGSGAELCLDYAGYEADFREFIGAAQGFVATLRNTPIP